MDQYSRSTGVMERERRYEVPSCSLHGCSACRYARTFAQHPRTYCTCASGVRAGQCVYAGQLACSHFAERPAG